MATETLLGKLKRAVNKIKFLINFGINRWKVASIIGAAASSRKRRLSFNDRPGLRACVDIDDDSGPDESPGSSRGLRRTTSYPLSDPEDDDVDKRADAFIANFYKQLQFERQISLQLRYCRGNSFDSSTSP